MTRVLMTMGLALLGLASVAGVGQAAFTVTITGLSGGTITLTGVNPASPNDSVLATGTAGGVFYSVNASSSENSTRARLNTTSVSFENNSGAVLNNVTVTISQNAFNFPFGVDSFQSNASVNTTTPVNGVTVATSATGQSTITLLNNAIVTSNASPSASVSGNSPGSGPFTVSQTLSFSGLGADQTVNFSQVSNVVASPVPATALLALGGLPLLGLAGGFARRRVAGV